MPPPDKDYSKGITFSPDVPSLCDDGWLFIGSMSAKPMRGNDVKSDSLYYSSVGNSKNIAWGEKKEVCELADHIGNDATTLTLKLGSWIPSQEDRHNKHELPRAIATKADEYFLQMTSRPEIDYSAPKTVEDAIHILTSELGLEIHKLDYIHGVSPANKLVLAAIAQEHPGIDVRTTHFFKRLQEEGHAPQDSDPRPQIIGSSASSFPTQDAQHQATGNSNIQQEKAPEVTKLLQGVEDQHMVTNFGIASQPDGESKGPRIVDQDGRLAGQHTADNKLSHSARPTTQNTADSLVKIQVPVEAITPPVSSAPLASPTATASRKRRLKLPCKIRGIPSPSISDSSDE